MKKWLLFVLLTVFMGCEYGAEKVRTYIDEPQTLIQDPHFMGYQEKMDALESSYLRKEMTYAEYLEQKKQLEEDYSREVQKRRETIESSGH